MNAKAGHRGKEGKGPRYAVYDFQYELDGGEGTRYDCDYCLTERRGLDGNEERRKRRADNWIKGTRLSSSPGAQMREHWSS